MRDLGWLSQSTFREAERLGRNREKGHQHCNYGHRNCIQRCSCLQFCPAIADFS